LLSIENVDKTFHGLLASDVKNGETRMLVVEGSTASSPAQEAGCLPGDVVVKAGSVDVVDGVDLERGLLGHAPGDKVDILVRRNEEVKTLTIQVAARPNPSPTIEQAAVDRVIDTNSAPAQQSDAWRLLGLKLSQLPESETSLVGPRYRGGMRVTQVRPNSPAAATGIRQGDILVGLHVWETTSPDNLRYVIEHPQLATFNPLKFYVVRGSETLYGHLQLAFRAE
jgi:serine protease Do